ncbi:TolB family protein [Dyella nitratireducens]|uniref:WD40-like Beta Propeller Repeat n=1 Tax=Dyella nitratireducens TaxID=1849580 RepID=A0ABQ1G883_9GAMM|nr:PD40 domain-containing protein [Dyella nitratireducens]GGA38670.1 hypothetical protein GCM10010981_29910 [Dyella nitratireducens]GLQ40348.1 hypothetical protein GCM10007902_01970 [Dyella nitratireducens]
MKFTQRVRRLAVTLSFVVTASCAAIYAPDGKAAEQAPDGSVLYSQSHVAAGDVTDATAIYVTPAAGGKTMALTPLTIGTLDLGARWSTYGHAIVFERVATVDWFIESQIYRLNRDNGTLQQITIGKSRHQYPVWGPSSWIAFIDGGVDNHQCLAMVRPNGNDQHTLFCPGPANGAFQPPQWSPDGKQLFVEIHYLGTEGLTPPSYSDVYSVDVATGKAIRISHLNTGDPAHLVISPDGTRGVYAWDTTSAMEIVNFITGKTSGGEFGDLYGSSPSWSHDSKHFAFSRNVTVTGSPFPFGAVFVMCAVSGDVRQITNKPDGFDFYYPVGWSRDDSHMLLNRTNHIVQGPNEGVYYSVNMLDVNTQAISTVADSGTADEGAWNEP